MFAEAPPTRSPASRLIAFLRRAIGLQPVRFLLVGGLNTLFGYALFAAFYLITRQRQPSLVAATVIGVAFNYSTIGRLVFARRGFGFLIPFVLGYVIVLGVNMAGLEALTRMGTPALLAQALLLPVTVGISYLFNRYVVFAR